jgi:hypothetical protein
MKTELTTEARKAIAAEILPFLKLNPEFYQLKRATMIHNGKPWHAGAKMQGGAKELTVLELMELSDAELLELQKKVFTAQKAKEIKSKNERFYLK